MTVKKEMTDKDRADIYIDLHKEQLGHFKQTRNIELRVNIALWTLLVLAGKFLKEDLKEAFTPDCPSILIYLLISFVVIFGHLQLWMIPIARSEFIDDHFIMKYRYMAEKICGTPISTYPKKLNRPSRFQDFESKQRRWIVGVVGTTALILLLIGFYLFI